jgi:DNA (cytosine-5)-methyltransferase 1
MREERGTLFDNIMYIVEKRRPSILLLENVRNLAGPRHRHEFDYIINRLRSAGYQVSAEPSIFSPHRIRQEFGGRPQIRERLFITATYAPRRRNHDPGRLVLPADVIKEDIHSWNILDFLDSKPSDTRIYELTEEEIEWIETWDSFLKMMRNRTGSKLPGFPLWSDEWIAPKSERARSRQLSGIPEWKKSFLRNNWAFYDAHTHVIDKWRRRCQIEAFPASRRKFEWQAQEAESLWDCTLHLRPSGIRAKRLTYLPALVAMSQTSIIGPLRRRLTPIEAARLQGLPDNFDFGTQPASRTYSQLGNGVNVGVVQQVLRAHILRDRELLITREPDLVAALSSTRSSRLEK